jgi:hypothetical protein
LQKARGTILERNSCRLPWSNLFDLSIRQNIPILSASRRIAVQLDIFNFGNLLNEDWGKVQESPYDFRNNIPLLSHTTCATGQTPGVVCGMTTTDRATAVPFVQFNYRTADPDKDGNLEPYRVTDFTGNFWRMQLSARVSF